LMRFALGNGIFHLATGGFVPRSTIFYHAKNFPVS
jgi:hypothetical protein